MARHSCTAKLIGVALLACAVFVSAVGAQPEARPEIGARGERGEARPRGRPERRRPERNWMAERIMHMIELGGQVGPDQARWLDRYLTNRLITPPSLNTLESAHYAVAEIYLRRGDHEKCLERLQRVIKSAGNRQDDAVWLTHLNIANIARTHLGDVQQAIREYRLVKGTWAGYAERELLRTLVDMGKLDEAVAVLQQQYEAATERGETLAVLRRIAEFYVQNNEDAKAIEAYDRIAKEFTAADIEEMKKAAARYVFDQAEKVVQLRNAHRFDEAEKLMRQVRRREATLRAQGRSDELRAFEAALSQAREKLEAWEREHRPEPREAEEADDE